MKKANPKDMTHPSKHFPPKKQKNQQSSFSKSQPLKASSSAKNLHEPIGKEKQNVDIQHENIGQSFHELRTLTQEKDELMEQLNILKQGAITALLQKEEIIDRLKNGWDIQQSYEDERSQMQKELNKILRRVKDLEEQRKQLMEKIQGEKNFYFEELYSREILIDSLDNKVRDLQDTVEALNDQNRHLTSQTIFLQNKNLELEKKIARSSKNGQQQEEEDDESELCLVLEKAKTEQEIIEYLYSERSGQVDEAEQTYKKKIEDIVEGYESQISQLVEELDKRKRIEEELRKTFQTELTEEKFDFDGYSLGSTKMKKFINLKCQVKDIDNLTICKRNSDEVQSQFTQKYFRPSLEPRSFIKYSCERNEVNVQEEYEIESEDMEQELKESWIEKKDLLVGLGGMVVGISLAGLLLRGLKN